MNPDELIQGKLVLLLLRLREKGSCIFFAPHHHPHYRSFTLIEPRKIKRFDKSQIHYFKGVFLVKLGFYLKKAFIGQNFVLLPRRAFHSKINSNIKDVF